MSNKKGGKIQSVPIQKEQFSIIIGTILGDGSMAKSRHNQKTAYLRFTHCYQQRQYCKYKSEKLINHANNGMFFKTYYNSKAKKDITTARFQSKFTQQLYNIYNMFYTPKKIIPENIGEYLTIEALAIWYMDDGSIQFSKSVGKGRKNEFQRHRINIHTNCFSYEQQVILSDAIYDNFGIRFLIKKADYGKHYILYMRKREHIQKFVEIVQPFIHQTMKYKIKLKYTKLKRRCYTKDKILKICKKLNMNKYSDIIKYRKGKAFYATIMRHFGSFNNLKKLL